MGTYLITGPDGKKYHVTGESPAGAMQALQEHLGGVQNAPDTGNPLAMPDYVNQQPDAAQTADLIDRARTQRVAGQDADQMEKNYHPGTFDDATNSAVMRGIPFADEIVGGLKAVPGAVSDWSKGDGFDVGKSYNRSVAMERELQKRRDDRSPYASILGSILGGAGVMGATSKASLLAGAKNTLPSIMARGAGDGAIYGSIYGAGEGENIDDRAEKALKGGAIGGALGLALPPALTGVIGAAKGVVRPIEALFRPEKYANLALGKTLERAGMTADEVAQAMRNATADNQGMFTAADAMGNAGRRALVPAVRTPNNMRQQIADFLMGRQMDQGRRIASSLSDATDTPMTAEQLRQSLSTARSDEATRNYLPVTRDTTAIDVSPAVAEANARISPAADRLANVRGDVPTDLAARAPIEAGERSIRDPIREAVRQARSYLASDNLTVTNVEKAFRAKTNIDQMIAEATKNGQGAQVEALMPMRDALDNALAATSQDYAAARDAYRTASQRVDAVDTGRDMARGRRRVADNMDTFAALPDDQARQAARVGYFDAKIAAAETNKGTMTNSARPFISESMRQELPAFAAPGRGDQLMRRLGREQTMFETSNAALGGSKTADNLADMEDASQFDPAIMGRLFRGDFLGAASQGAKQALQLGKGQPPRVLERVGRSLIETNPDAAASVLGPAQAKRVSNEQLRKMIYDMLIGGASQQVGQRVGQPLN